MALLNGADVAKHGSAQSCWIVIDAKVYDFTSFVNEHPGGATILLKHAGGDATEEFKKYHPEDYVEDLPDGSLLGSIDPVTISALNNPKSATAKSSAVSGEGKAPHISLCVSAHDFEAAAKAVLPSKSWVYASSSANTGLSLKQNIDDWSRISFRPRIFRNVEVVDMSTTILGQPSPYPFYVSPMGTLGNIHPNGEPEIVQGLVRKGMHGVISTASTKPTEQIMQSFIDEQKSLNNSSPSKLFFQLYIHSDRNKAIDLLRKVKKLGYKGIWITVDTPFVGKRTADKLLQAQEALAAGLGGTGNQPFKGGGENTFAPAFGGRPVPGQLDPRLTWEYLKWVKEEWDGPIVLKGIQCAEDAKLAFEHGCHGILLSNHGGRQLHTAPSALMTLLEIRTYCPEILGKIEIFLDGGLRDGADVLKALCLGATAVGVGRPFLYALGAYGAQGVEKCTDILAEEVILAMRLLGITSLDQVRPELVNASRLLNEMWRPEWPAKSSRL